MGTLARPALALKTGRARVPILRVRYFPPFALFVIPLGTLGSVLKLTPPGLPRWIQVVALLDVSGILK